MSHTSHTPAGSDREPSNAGPPPGHAGPAPGWAQQPLSAYERGDSGGWGGPDSGPPTGPIPRIRRGSPPVRRARTSQASRPEAPAGPTSVGEHVPAASTQTATAQIGPATRSTPTAQPRPGTPKPERHPKGFSSRVATELAPITFWLVLAYLVLDFVQTLLAFLAGGPLIALIGGLVKVVAFACLARVVLETCERVAGRGPRRSQEPESLGM